MRRYLPVVVILLALFVTGTSLVFARGLSQDDAVVVEGAQLYDKWYAALGVDAPEGDMPLWSRQTTNSRSGADTWRCSECHGWDYKGNQGAYASGSHFTGFPSLMIVVPDLTSEEIVAHLQGANDPGHDFSAYLDQASMEKLAVFLKEGLIDDSLYIDSVSLQVIDGDVEHGRELYVQTCASCHGEDGKRIVFRTEGVDEYLGAVADRDPFRFLHRTRFGVAGTEMPVGYNLGWSPADGRDVLAYAQTLPTGAETETPLPGSEISEPGPQVGGPGSNLWSGILTAVAAFFATFGSALLFLAVLVAVVVVIVRVLRRR